MSSADAVYVVVGRTLDCNNDAPVEWLVAFYHDEALAARHADLAYTYAVSVMPKGLSGRIWGSDDNPYDPHMYIGEGISYSVERVVRGSVTLDSPGLTWDGKGAA